MLPACYKDSEVLLQANFDLSSVGKASFQPPLARSQGVTLRHLGRRVIAAAVKSVGSSWLENQAALLGCHRVAARRMHLGDVNHLQYNLERSAASSRRCILFQASCATPSCLNARERLSKFQIKPCTLPDARLQDLKIGHRKTHTHTIITQMISGQMSEARALEGLEGDG